MNSRMRYLGWCLIILLTGCSTLSRNQCQSSDWEKTGYGDGISGYKSAKLDLYNSSCKEHGIVPNETAYLTGYEKGNKKYCTSVKGLSEGMNYRSYLGVCSPETAYDFMAGYDFGHKFASMYEQLRDGVTKVNVASRKIQEYEMDIRFGLHGQKLSEKEKYKKLKRIEDELNTLEMANSSLQDLKKEVSSLVHELGKQMGEEQQPGLTGR